MITEPGVWINERAVYRSLTFPAWLLCVFSIIGTVVYWATLGMRFVARGEFIYIALSVIVSAAILWIVTRFMGYQLILDFSRRKVMVGKYLLGIRLLWQKEYDFAELRKIRKESGGFDSIGYIRFEFVDGREFVFELERADEFEQIRERLWPPAGPGTR